MPDGPLSAPQLRYIGYLLQGLPEGTARQNVKVPPDTLLVWRQNPDFRLAEKAACEQRSVFHRADAISVAERHSALLMAEAIGIAYEAPQPRDRLTAIKHVHEAVGIGSKDTSVTINTQAQQLIQNITLAIKEDKTNVSHKQSSTPQSP